MKLMMALLLLTSYFSAMAAETNPNPTIDRYVADNIEIETMPNGEIVTRLVSKRRLTAQQFWIASVYYPYGNILVFQGRGGSTHSLSRAGSKQKDERQISKKARAAFSRSLDSALESKESSVSCL